MTDRLKPTASFDAQHPLQVIAVLLLGVVLGLVLVVLFMIVFKNCCKRLLDEASTTKGDLNKTNADNVNENAFRDCNQADYIVIESSPSVQVKNDVPSTVESYFPQPPVKIDQCHQPNVFAAKFARHYAPLANTDTRASLTKTNSSTSSRHLKIRAVHSSDVIPMSFDDEQIIIEAHHHPEPISQHQIDIRSHQQSETDYSQQDMDDYSNMKAQEWQTERDLPKALQAPQQQRNRPPLQKQKEVNTAGPWEPQHTTTTTESAPSLSVTSIGHLPRSGQPVIERNSPSPSRARKLPPIVFDDHDERGNARTYVKEAFSQSYDAYSKPLAAQDGSQFTSFDQQVPTSFLPTSSGEARERAINFAQRNPRIAFSFTEASPQELNDMQNQPVRQKSMCAPSPDAPDCEVLNSFYRQMQCYTQNNNPALQSSSSGSNSNVLYPLQPGVRQLNGHNVPSITMMHDGSLNQKQYSLTSEDGSQSPCVDDNQLTDAPLNEVLEQCHSLWGLRTTLEDCAEAEEDSDVITEQTHNIQIPIVGQSVDEPEAISAATSYTTSYESNTDAAALEDYLKHQRPSTTFLEPPKLSLEAKRQKYKNLFARRQEQLRQQRILTGTSIETSVDSFGTVSSESSFQMMPTSMESNNAETDSTQDSVRKKISEIQNDSGFKSQSTDQQQMTIDNPDNPGCSYQYKNEAILQLKTEDDANSPNTGQEMKNESTSSKTDTPIGAPEDSLPQNWNKPPYPVNPHLVWMRKSMERGSRKRNGATRDFSIDARTDQIFREFVRYDPNLELSTAAVQRRGKLADGHGCTLGSSQDSSTSVSALSSSLSRLRDSIDELDEHDAAPEDPHRAFTAPVTRWPIPEIRLPDEQECE